MSEMYEKYVYETNDRSEYLNALHATDFLLTLWDLDQWLRTEVKYSQDNTSEMREAYQKARSQLNEIMRERYLSLDMLR